jgi:putative ABC transport system permease protein
MSVSLWRQLTRGLRALTRRSAVDQEVADEVRDYLDRATAEYVARGLQPEEAYRAARLELGNVTSVSQQVRESGWENLLETLIADLRYAARRLVAEPGFATVTVLTLAVGVGSTTAIFSALNPILFQPLPYPDAGRIMMVWDIFTDGSRADVTFGTYQELLERSRSFEALAVVKPWQPTLIGTTEPERLEGQSVSSTFFRVLGVPPALGRDFQASDDRAGAPRVVILSEGLWRRRLGGDRTVVGRSITLGDDPYVVIGVMPPGFENVLDPSATLWTPLQYDMSQDRAWGHHLRMLGRLRPGVGTDEAAAELARIAGTPVREFARVPWASLKNGLTVNSLQDDVTRGVRPALLIILGAVVVVLVIACVNVTNLLLARGVRRRAEFALRAALGAGSTRLIRQLLTESLLLALLGGAVGMAVAMLGVRALIALSPPELPRVHAIAVDSSVFAFGLGLTTLIGLAFGLTPALQAARSDQHQELQHGSSRTSSGHRRTRSALVVAEVALALVLLVSSGLLLRSLQQLFAVAPGFQSSRLITMQVQTSGHRFDEDSTTYRFFEQALEAVRQVPGVTAAALTSQLPLSGDMDIYGVHFESSPTQRAEEDHSAFRYAVSPGYLETMRIPLRRGRLLDEHDRSGAPLVALINESYARREFPGIDPVGQRLRIGPMDSPLYTIVGVVGDVKQVSLAISQSDAVYTTPSQWRFADNVMSLVVRTRRDPTALVPAIRQAVWSVDKDQPIVRVATMDDLVAASAAERRFALILVEAFALAALVLAAAGIYGVLSGRVAERTREIGVRSALGASRGNILALVVGQGMTLTGVGISIGLAGAALASEIMVALLFGVSHLDPVAYLGAMMLLATVAVIACSVPAWRAARVDPASTLRAE